MDRGTYYTAVTAYNDIEESNYSNEVSGIPEPDSPPDVTLPEPPTELGVTITE